jgi:hypothetical protein
MQRLLRLLVGNSLSSAAVAAAAAMIGFQLAVLLLLQLIRVVLLAS